MARRKFTREFKVSAVQLVNQQGYSVSAAAKSLGVDRNCVRQWVDKLGPEAGLAPSGGGGLKGEPPRVREGEAPSGEGALKAELQRLRKENARLLVERDILKKAAAFFAKEQP